MLISSSKLYLNFLELTYVYCLPGMIKCLPEAKQVLKASISTDCVTLLCSSSSLEHTVCNVHLFQSMIVNLNVTGK